MHNELEPLVGNWYCHLDKGQLFQVIDVDEAEGLIEIQRFDGDIEAIDFDAWRTLDIELAEPPEDWTGPVDDLEPDDIGYSCTEMEAPDWRRGTGEYPPGREAWEPFDGEAELDDFDDLWAAMSGRRGRPGSRVGKR